MAMNDDCQIEYHFLSEQKFTLNEVDSKFEVDSFDYGDRFDMDFGTESFGF